MNLIKETRLKLLTTPQELREIADTLEAEYPNLKCGDSTILSYRIVKSGNGEIIWADFGVDQTRMEVK